VAAVFPVGRRSSSVLANFKGLTRQNNFARIAAMASKGWGLKI